MAASCSIVAPCARTSAVTNPGYSEARSSSDLTSVTPSQLAEPGQHPRALLPAAVHEHDGDVVGGRRGVLQQAVHRLLGEVLQAAHHDAARGGEERGRRQLAELGQAQARWPGSRRSRPRRRGRRTAARTPTTVRSERNSSLPVTRVTRPRTSAGVGPRMVRSLAHRADSSGRRTLTWCRTTSRPATRGSACAVSRRRPRRRRRWVHSGWLRPPCGRGPRAPVRRSATAPVIAVVGAGLAGLTCAYELAKHGVVVHGLRGQPRPPGRPVLDLPRLGARADRRARRRVHRHRPPLDPAPGRRARARARRPVAAARWTPAGPRTLLPARAHGAPRTRSTTATTSCASRPTATPPGSAPTPTTGPATRPESSTSTRPPSGCTASSGTATRSWRPRPRSTCPRSTGWTSATSVPSTWSSEFASGGLPSDERFHVRGGNDQLVTGLAGRLPPGTVVQDARLDLADPTPGRPLPPGLPGRSRRGGRTWSCCARRSRRCGTWTSTGAGLSRRKRDCIEQLGMGTNAKVLVQLDRHVTHYGRTPTSRWSGEYYDARVDTWASSLAERGRTSLLTVYSGGHGSGRRTTSSRPHGPAPHHVVDRTLAEITRAVPRICRPGTAGGPGSTRGSTTPTRHGSYAAFRPGQFTQVLGLRRKARAPRALRRRAHLDARAGVSSTAPSRPDAGRRARSVPAHLGQPA